MKNFSRLIGICVCVFWTLAAAYGAEIKVELQKRGAVEFKEPGIIFRNDFPGGRMNRCERIGDGEFRIIISPENFPVNNSAWYAFQVVSRETKTISVTLAYEKGKHRYQPKISRDGRSWAPIGKDRYKHDRKTGRATLTLDVGPRALWVAGQEMIGVKEINAWADRLQSSPDVSGGVFGKSMRGAPLRQLDIPASGKPNYVFIISRQHPPEITGTMGLMAFIERVQGADELAKRFRAEFTIVLAPLMNPDGVNEGHWRHNLGGVDLNRDWKNFNQPETRQVRDYILKRTSEPGAKPWLFLDFHSTSADVFYTQRDQDVTEPKDFTKNWLSAIRKRLPDYRVKRNGSHNVSAATSKSWAYNTLGCPAITYEYGDHTDRKLIEQTATVAAEEMMKLLLAEAAK